MNFPHYLELWQVPARLFSWCCTYQVNIWAGAQQFLQYCMCATWRLRTACASVQSDLSLCRALCVVKDPECLQENREDWSDSVDVQADLNLCWVHMQSCRECCAPAHFFTLLQVSGGECSLNANPSHRPIPYRLCPLFSSSKILTLVYYTG